MLSIHVFIWREGFPRNGKETLNTLLTDLDILDSSLGVYILLRYFKMHLSIKGNGYEFFSRMFLRVQHFWWKISKFEDILKAR